MKGSITSRFADRRGTQQPSNNDTMLEDMQGIYERNSPQKTFMFTFGEHQKLTSNRLSVPHSRRQRERFNGTQNSFHEQTYNPYAEEGEIS